mmetsp:Transcript_53551/g.148504  ORF Transcript_53551/g.148504 Transcript_53551/m.148504 type:complete len:205 (+) Transcript_53551:164-778(+)
MRSFWLRLPPLKSAAIGQVPSWRYAEDHRGHLDCLQARRSWGFPSRPSCRKTTNTHTRLPMRRESAAPWKTMERRNTSSWRVRILSGASRRPASSRAPQSCRNDDARGPRTRPRQRTLRAPAAACPAASSARARSARRGSQRGAARGAGCPRRGWPRPCAAGPPSHAPRCAESQSSRRYAGTAAVHRQALRPPNPQSANWSNVQ